MSLAVQPWNSRERQLILLLANGELPTRAVRKLGWDWTHPERIITPAMLAQVEKLKLAASERAFEKDLLDGNEILEYFTDAIRARMSDIRNDDHTFKPRSEWPDIWDRLEEGGDVEVTYESARSHDGEDTDGLGGWEKTGRTVEKVKFKFASRTKLLELAMKHKGVDAMVGPTDKLAGAVSDVAAAIRGKLNAALEREKVIDVTPE